MTINWWRGSTRSMFFRLCWRAPLMMMNLSGVMAAGAMVGATILFFDTRLTLTGRGVMVLTGTRTPDRSKRRPKRQKERTRRRRQFCCGAEWRPNGASVLGMELLQKV